MKKVLFVSLAALSSGLRNTSVYGIGALGIVALVGLGATAMTATNAQAECMSLGDPAVSMAVDDTGQGLFEMAAAYPNGDGQAVTGDVIGDVAMIDDAAPLVTQHETVASATEADVFYHGGNFPWKQAMTWPLPDTAQAETWRVADISTVVHEASGGGTGSTLIPPS